MAAKRAHVTQRNADYASILQKVTFTDVPSSDRSAATSTSGLVSEDGTFGILQHDFVFWLGDLNYRIVEGISIEQVHTRVEADDLEFLRDRDQVCRLLRMWRRCLTSGILTSFVVWVPAVECGEGCWSRVPRLQRGHIGVLADIQVPSRNERVRCIFATNSNAVRADILVLTVRVSYLSFSFSPGTNDARKRSRGLLPGVIGCCGDATPAMRSM